MVRTISRRECIHQTTLNCNITPNISSILQRLFHGGRTEAARQHGVLHRETRRSWPHYATAKQVPFPAVMVTVSTWIHCCMGGWILQGRKQQAKIAWPASDQLAASTCQGATGKPSGTYTFPHNDRQPTRVTPQDQVCWWHHLMGGVPYIWKWL